MPGSTIISLFRTAATHNCRLTPGSGFGNSGLAMRTPSLLRAVPALAALAFTLSACNTKGTTINAADSDDMKEQLSKAPPVTELPPSISATKTFRCADNSVVAVDFYSDGKSARLTPKDKPPVAVKADEAGKPMTGEGGYTLDGKSTESAVKITLPGKDAQTCDE
jgi:hypothetical protein